jgi:hypothetical protein
MQSEGLLAYRRRALRPWVKYSQEFSAVNVDELNEPLLTPIEQRIYNDAIAASSNPTIAPEGMLREVHRRDQTGREIVEFYGQPRDWMRQFAGNRRRVIAIRNTSTA